MLDYRDPIDERDVNPQGPTPFKKWQAASYTKGLSLCHTYGRRERTRLGTQDFLPKRRDYRREKSVKLKWLLSQDLDGGGETQGLRRGRK